MKKILTLLLAAVLVFQISPVATSANAKPIKVYMEGKQLKPDIAPYISNGRTLIEARSIFESMGYTMAYDNKSRIVTGTRENSVMKLTINSKTATVNGKKVTLDVAPTIKNGRTVVPVRFVAESAGIDITWDNAKREVRAQGIQLQPGLENWVRRELGIDDTKPILPIDLAVYTALDFYVGYPADAPIALYFENLNDLVHFPNLKSIDLQGSFTNVRALSKLSKLEHVNLTSYSYLTNLDGLENKPNLKSVSISTVGSIVSLKPLENATKLQKLVLSEKGKFEKDLSSLAKMKDLQWLSISNVTDDQVQYLNKLTNLTGLSITDSPKLTTIENLDLPNLTSLDIVRSSLNKITMKSDLSKLVSLRVPFNQLTELPNAEHMPNLKGLYAPNNQIQSVKSLQQFKSITDLTLTNNQIEDLTPLANLTTLTSIAIGNNKLTSLAPLRNLQSLYLIDAMHNDITSLEGLENLTNLQYLFVAGNEIQSLVPVASLPRLNKIYAHSNPIEALPNFVTTFDYEGLRISATIDFELLAEYAKTNQIQVIYNDENKAEVEALQQSLIDQHIYNLTILHERYAQ